MFWGCFGYNSRTELLALNGDPTSARGGVTSRIIWHVYRDTLPTFLAANDIFIHDNASTHTARIIQQLFQDLGITTMI